MTVRLSGSMTGGEVRHQSGLVDAGRRVGGECGETAMNEAIAS